MWDNTLLQTHADIRSSISAAEAAAYTKGGVTQHTLSSDLCMACHPNMTLNRDVFATQIPARLAKPPRERRQRLPQALVNTNKGFQQLKSAIFSGMPEFHIRSSLSAAEAAAYTQGGGRSESISMIGR